jgi:hypothetical protein
MICGAPRCRQSVTRNCLDLPLWRPADKRNPAFLIVDEAAEYFDENLETLLQQARKFNVGVLFAHQHLDQLTSDLRASVAANTSIKIAGGVSDKDARGLASDMRTTPDFITGMTKRARSTEFACYVRNYTANAVKLTIPFGALEAAPTMSQEEHSKLIARTREQYGREQERQTAATLPADLPPRTTEQPRPVQRPQPESSTDSRPASPPSGRAPHRIAMTIGARKQQSSVLVRESPPKTPAAVSACFRAARFSGHRRGRGDRAIGGVSPVPALHSHSGSHRPLARSHQRSPVTPLSRGVPRSFQSIV